MKKPKQKNLSFPLINLGRFLSRNPVAIMHENIEVGDEAREKHKLFLGRLISTL